MPVRFKRGKTSLPPSAPPEISPCSSLVGATPHARWTRGEDAPTSLPRGEGAPQDNRESRGAAHGVHKKLFSCLPQGATGGLGDGARRSQEGLGALCQTSSLQPAAAATACPTVASWCFSFPTGKAGRLSAQPSPDTMPGSVSALRTSSPGNPRYRSSSTVVLQCRVTPSSIDNICMFFPLPQNLGLPVMALVLQTAGVPFLAPYE